MTEIKKDDVVVLKDRVTQWYSTLRRGGVYRVSLGGINLTLDGVDQLLSPEAFRKLEVGDIVRALDDPYADTGWDVELEVTEISNRIGTLVHTRPLVGELEGVDGAFAVEELEFVRPGKTESERTVDLWMEGYGEEVEVDESDLFGKGLVVDPRNVIWARNWVVSMEDHMSASDLFDHIVGSGFLTNEGLRSMSGAFEADMVDGNI